MTSKMNTLLVSVLLGLTARAQEYTATYDPAHLPPTTEGQQLGTNQCGTGNNQTSLCQNVYLNSIHDFCLWGPPEPNSEIGVIEQYAVSYCTFPGRGGRLIPEGTFTSVHFVESPDYVQITGTGDFTKINIKAGDAGGELDPHGPDGFGNPHGGLVFSNIWVNGTTGLGEQIHEWTSFMSSNQFCIRACKAGPQATALCQHIYDVMGCVWNIPGDYADGFDSCQGDDTLPMGLYPIPGGGTSTYFQGQGPPPDAHPPAATSSCSKFSSAAALQPTTTPTTTVSGTSPTHSGTSTTRSNDAAALNVKGSGVMIGSVLFGALAAYFML